MSLDLVSLLAASEIPEPLLPLWAMELLASVFIYAWLFCLGATVGSFLNVVVYRLPRGKNLAYPGSFCPRCGHPIRLADNIPILSWLLLRGRCRDCGGRISARYFAVELTIAVVFLVVLVGEHFLPVGSLGFAAAQALAPRDGAPFWCRYALHVVLVTTLIGAVLLRADDRRVPAEIFLPVLAAGFLLPLIWPAIRSVPALSHHEPSSWQAGLIDGLAGMCMGIGLGLPASFVVRREGWPPLAVIGLACSIGVVLGWQRSLVWFPCAWLVCELAACFVQRFTQPDDATESPKDAPSADAIETYENASRPEGAAATPPQQNLDLP